MHALKVHKVGNSLNLRLPKDAANTLRVTEGDTVYLTETTNGGYRVTPYDPDFERQMELAEKGMKAPHSRSGASHPLGTGSASGPRPHRPPMEQAPRSQAPFGVCSMEEYRNALRELAMK